MELSDFDLDDLWVVGKPLHRRDRRGCSGTHVGQHIVKQSAMPGKKRKSNVVGW